MRRRDARVPSSPATAVALLALLLSQCAPACASRSTPPSRTHRFQARQDRDNPEHVVLADCRDTTGVLSSQMAYFPRSPNGTPQDVAVVKTDPGKTRLWVSATTSALFTTSGVTFTARIGPQVSDGQFAGTGNNGFGDFVCYQDYVSNLYTYDGTTCSQVYSCNHDPVPSNIPTPTPSSGAGGNNGTSGASKNEDSGKGLSQGAEIAIIVGSVAAVCIGIVAIVFWFLRRRQQRKQPGYVPGSGRGCCGLFGRKQKPAELHGQGAWAALPRDSPTLKKETPVGPGAGQVYEMDGRWHGVEMYSYHSRGELDSAPPRVELDSKQQSAQAGQSPQVYVQPYQDPYQQQQGDPYQQYYQQYQSQHPQQYQR